LNAAAATAVERDTTESSPTPSWPLVDNAEIVDANARDAAPISANRKTSASSSSLSSSSSSSSSVPSSTTSDLVAENRLLRAANARAAAEAHTLHRAVVAAGDATRAATQEWRQKAGAADARASELKLVLAVKVTELAAQEASVQRLRATRSQRGSNNNNDDDNADDGGAAGADGAALSSATLADHRRALVLLEASQKKVATLLRRERTHVTQATTSEHEIALLTQSLTMRDAESQRLTHALASERNFDRVAAAAATAEAVTERGEAVRVRVLL
jgi:hypothetical protein